MLILQRYIGTIRNAQITAASIDLRYPAPSWHASYGQVFECPVHFSRLNNRLRIPFAWREVPNLGYDESAWHAARQKCDEIVVGSSPRNTLSRVRAEIFAAFDQCHGSPAVPTLERVAERIHLSHRTLIRRLRAVGTSFHEELDDVRKVRAVDLVERGRRVSEVAELLGYNDPGNFTKAFRRWFGVPPSRFRNQDGIQHKTRAARQTGDDGETDV